MNNADGSASIIPVDIEGQYFLLEIPVVGGGSGTAELGENLGLVLSKVDGAIVHGHGTFVVGGTVEEAYVATARIEHSCKIRYYLDLVGNGKKVISTMNKSPVLRKFYWRF